MECLWQVVGGGAQQGGEGTPGEGGASGRHCAVHWHPQVPRQGTPAGAHHQTLLKYVCVCVCVCVGQTWLFQRGKYNPFVRRKKKIYCLVFQHCDICISWVLLCQTVTNTMYL